MNSFDNRIRLSLLYEKSKIIRWLFIWLLLICTCLISIYSSIELVNRKTEISETSTLNVTYTPEGKMDLASDSSGSFILPLRNYSIPETFLGKISNIGDAKIPSQYCFVGYLRFQDQDGKWKSLSGSSSIIIGLNDKKIEFNELTKKSPCIASSEWQEAVKKITPAIIDKDIDLLIKSPATELTLLNGERIRTKGPQTKPDSLSLLGAIKVQSNANSEVYSVPFSKQNFSQIVFPLQITLKVFIEPTITQKLLICIFSLMIAVIFSVTFLTSLRKLWEMLRWE